MIGKTLYKHIYAGLKVYVVNKANINEYVVTEEKPWSTSKYDGLIYRLRSTGKYKMYNILQDSALDIEEKTNEVNIHKGIYSCDKYFSNKRNAVIEVNRYLKEHNKDILILNDSDFIEKHIYSYVRECDKKEMIAYYCITKNGLAYVKNYMTFNHVIKHSEKELKAFIKDCLENGIYDKKKVRKIETMRVEPEIMYKCVKESGWLYADAEYGMCI